MDWQLLFLSFSTVFISELGDKSQLVTMSLSGSSASPRAVFVGATSALLLASGVGVILGEGLSTSLPTNLLKGIAALIFAVLGLRSLMDD
ncbi:MAG: TMEM165/GDT1 family protein [Pseudanabaenaceae cyanobacterium bins.68]|nr:TMEM165/GDT1 family protein [Pseudanabaenaceae cyanobacterium bins.68]